MLDPVRKATANTSERRKEALKLGIRVDFEVSIAQDLGNPSDLMTVYQGSAVAMMNDNSERKIEKIRSTLLNADASRLGVPCSVACMTKLSCKAHT